MYPWARSSFQIYNYATESTLPVSDRPIRARLGHSLGHKANSFGLASLSKVLTLAL